MLSKPKPYIIANWKMHGSSQSIEALLGECEKHPSLLSGVVDVVLLPPFPYLQQVRSHLTRLGSIKLGAQDASLHRSGAYTGEVSPWMLEDCGCRYVLVGHSERREYHAETNTIVAAKFLQIKAAGCIPILCVGESEGAREKGRAYAVIESQLQAVVEASKEGARVFKDTILAYEPLWAIGTGKAATPNQVQVIHHKIRAYIRHLEVDIAKQLPLLYGGSVKPDNAAALFAMPDIDGGLIGGASLIAEQFLEIIRLCTTCY